MLLVSTGFKDLILGPHAFADIFNGGVMQIFNGGRPTTADDTPGGTLIAQITQSGLPWAPDFTPYGMRFVKSGSYVLLDPARDWQLLPNDFATLGIAVWWRLVAPGDDGVPSVTRPRIDGDIAVKGSTGGQELLLDSLTLVPRLATPVHTWFYTIPPIPGA